MQKAASFVPLLAQSIPVGDANAHALLAAEHGPDVRAAAASMSGVVVGAQELGALDL
jgi:hypothetical protein